MNKQSITFKADEQELIKTGGINSYASNIVAYIEATFELGENWTGYDSVRAVWSNDYLTDISTVLDPNGRCIVPTEVLTDTGNVTVNLVGSISVDDELTDRLTTYPCKALTVDEDAKVEGDETESITPSQFEQFVSIVHDEVEEVTGMSAEASTLPAGSDATASYSDGVLSLGIPKGADGVDGKDGKDGVTPDIDIGTVETLETGAPAYANITGTVENPSLNLGLPKGNTGDAGATGAPAGFGAVTATIDGTTGTPSVDVTASGADTAKNFAFAFHNLKGEQGEQGEQGEPGVVQDVTVNGTSVVDQNGVAVIKVPELVKTVQGNPIVLDDAFGEVKNLTVELLPIQEGSGTPSPQNVRPITGHDSVTVGVTGVNQWDEQYANGYWDTTTGEYVEANLYMSSKYKIPVRSNTAYYFKSPVQMILIAYDANGDKMLWDNANYKVANGLLTMPVGCHFVTFRMAAGSYGGTTYNHDISINYPSTDTSYHAYHGQSKTVTLPHTVYGAGVGVTSGEGKEKVYFAQINPNKVSKSENETGYFWYSVLSSNNMPNIASLNAGLLCERLEANNNTDWEEPDGVITVYANGIIRWKEQGGMTLADYKTYLASNPLRFCYRLATPTDLSTTPTPLTLYSGDNVISSDGDMELTYVQDMAVVIEKLENLL